MATLSICWIGVECWVLVPQSTTLCTSRVGHNGAEARPQQSHLSWILGQLCGKKACWSLQWAYAGVHPSTDQYGRPFPPNSREGRVAGTPLTRQGHRFVLWNLLGDRDFMCRELGLPWPTSDNCCFFCRACRTDPRLAWNNFRPDNEWEATEYTADELFKTPSSTHMVFGSIPGVTQAMLCYDILHNTDRHGVSSHFCGNVLFELVWRSGGTPGARLRLIWRDIQRHYDSFATTCRLTNLTERMIVDTKSLNSSYPELKAKAAETRHLVPVIYELCKTYNSGPQHDARRLRAAGHLCSFYSFVEAFDNFLPLHTRRICSSM